jgi:hypothetical protein
MFENEVFGTTSSHVRGPSTPPTSSTINNCFMLQWSTRIMCTTPTQKIVEFQNLQVGPNKLLSFKTLKFDLKGNGK